MISLGPIKSPRATGSASADAARAKPAAIARVLHVINGEHYAGAERVQDLLAAELGPLGFEVGLACIKPGQFPKVRRSLGVPLYELPMRSRFDLRPLGALVRLIRQEGYTLLHAHTPRTALLAALASMMTGVPLVYHVHSPTSRDSTRRWQNWINAIIERLSLLWASALIAVSHSVGRHVRRQGFTGRRLAVVPNGVPCRPPCRSPQLPQGVWTLGTTALFRPRKGMEVLLRALALLKMQGLPVRLRAVGGFETPAYEHDVKRLAAELGLAEIIDWTGFTADVDSQLARMDLFVLPSLFGEGLPMVVLEAMAAGVPVVATRVEGIPEAIGDAQQGLLAKPGDAEDLAGAIARIVRGQVDWSALRRSAIQRQAEQFSDRSMAAGVAQVYRQVLGVTGLGS